MPTLTTGAIAAIMEGRDCVEPILQVLSVKKMNTGLGQPEKDRYRLNLSDGENSLSYAMMTAPVYNKAGSAGIPKNSIIKVLRFLCNVVNNTGGKNSRVLLVLDMEVVENGDDVGDRIGDPTPYKENPGNAKESSNIPPPVSMSSAQFNGSSNEVSLERPSKVPKLMQSATNGAGTSNGNITLNTNITHPITSLSPYQNRWVIKARVINKGDIKKWENARGSGQLFSLDLADESGEIRCTAFREMVDKFYDLLQVDKTYYISKCQLKPANKQFNTMKNDYEMTMTSETIIEECTDDSLDSLKTQYHFVDIKSIASADPNEIVDVLGVVTTVGDLQTFQAKSTGRELKKKEVQLLDQSNCTVTLTLWGNQAENFHASGNPVIALKGARIAEFGGGKSLSTISGTIMKINPEITECFKLKGWYDSEGKNSVANDLSARTGGGGGFGSTPWMCFKEVHDQQFGTIDQTRGDYYKVKGTVLLIRSENAVYKACSSADCNKKVVDNGDGTYRCEKCMKTDSNFKYRLLCGMNVGDWSGNLWLSMFNDEAEKVIGMSAEEMGHLLDEDKTRYQEAMHNCNFKEFVFTCRAKMEQFNDESRLKTVAVRVEPLNYEDYSAQLIDNIKKYHSA